MTQYQKEFDNLPDTVKVERLLSVATRYLSWLHTEKPSEGVILDCTKYYSEFTGEEISEES